MNTTDVMGLPVFSGSLDKNMVSSDKVLIINTLNAYCYVVARRDPLYMEALRASDILLPDGFPVVWAACVLSGVKIKKIAGAEIFLHLMQRLNVEGGRAFFLGSSSATLARIQSRASGDFPKVVTGSYSPPYKPLFDADDSRRMIEAVNTFSPHVLFVGMTAPKQEKWVYEHKAGLAPCVVCSVGAVFDFYAETVKRPSDFWVRLKMEWLVRLLSEPRRLWKRYLVHSPVFFYYLLQAYVRGRRA